MFALSEVIVCINNNRIPEDIMECPLVIGRKYRVRGLTLCLCGQIYVDVGIRVPIQTHEVVCGCKARINDGTWWFDVKRFRHAGYSFEGSPELAQALKSFKRVAFCEN